MADTADQDPIFVTIERHRNLSTLLSAATAVSAKLLNESEFEAANEITAARASDLNACSHALIRSEPTTMAGAAALTRYVANLGEWQMPTDGPETEDDSRDPSDDWRRQVFLNTLANALDKISAKA
ncbi:hypothetical protein ACVWXN_003489 [Bradyrhizobium sp. i1.4.4]